MTGLTLNVFADRVSENLVSISKEFMRHRPGDFYKMKVTLPQLAILELLYRSNELNMSDMARFMNVTTAAMTGIVDRLVRDGYVIRTAVPNDRRVIKIKLMAKGNKIAKDVIEQRRHLITKIFGTLSHIEREEYLNLLTRIREGLNK